MSNGLIVGQLEQDQFFYFNRVTGKFEESTNPEKDEQFICNIGGSQDDYEWAKVIAQRDYPFISISVKGL